MITFSCRMTSTASITDPGSTDFPPSCPDAAHEGNGAASSTPFLAVRGPVQTAAQVEIVVPVKDEERDLERSVIRLRAYLTDSFPFTAHVTIADNGSSDGTWAIAARLAGQLPGVSAVRLAAPGRGRALRAIWSVSECDVLAYMDVDLSTDLNALLPLVAPLLSGHSDLAIGTRLARGARVVRGPRREFISRGYNLLLQATLGARFSDAQCGFKAIRRECAAELLPRTQDSAWFFDTELLVLAERAGLRIHEVPVDWTEDPDSRVDVRATAAADIRGIVRTGRPAPAGQVRRRRGGEHRRLRAALPGPAAGPRGAGGQRDQPAAHRHREHGRQPPGHVRHRRAAARRAAPGPRPARVRGRAGADLRRTRRAARGRAAAGRAAELGVLAGRQSRRHAAAVRPVPQLGIPREHGMTAVTAGQHTRTWTRSGAMSATAPARRYRIALFALLAATAALYLVGLSRNGWANDFYSAAVQAGTKSWKAFFFGSFDSANFITVDKTPASLWVMELSGRVFGLNYWSMLVPQALEGVASVAVLYAAVRRWHGPAAGLLAGAALAVTPVAALMFRFNNPDSLLVLLMTAAAYGTVRAVESGKTRWLVLAGALLGFGFLTKMLQAFLVLPAFGLAYLVAGPRRLPVRLAQLAAGLVAVVVAAGWWVAAVHADARGRPALRGRLDERQHPAARARL